MTAGHDEFRNIGDLITLRAPERSESGGLSDIEIASLVVRHSFGTFASDRRQTAGSLISISGRPPATAVGKYPIGQQRPYDSGDFVGQRCCNDSKVLARHKTAEPVRQLYVALSRLYN
jgi:hypothetical protein